MADALVNGEPEVRGIQHEGVLAGRDRLRGELLPGVLGGAAGVLDHVVPDAVLERAWAGVLACRPSRQILPAHADRRRKLAPALEAAGGCIGDGDAEARDLAMDVLVSVGAFGGCEIALLIDEAQAGIHEAGAGPERSGTGRGEEVGLLGERHLEGVLLDGRLPGHLTVTRHRCQLHRLGLEPGVGPGYGDRLARRAGDAVRSEVIGRGETPGAAGDDPHPAAIRLGVGDAGDPAVARAHRLAEVAIEPGIGVGGAGRLRGVERGIRQSLAIGAGNRRQRPRDLGVEGAKRRQRCDGRGAAGVLEEVSSAHGHLFTSSGASSLQTSMNLARRSNPCALRSANPTLATSAGETQ